MLVEMPINPFGSPPRRPLLGHGIMWRGERWFIGDACRAVGMSRSTFDFRRTQMQMTIETALETPVKGHGLPRVPTAQMLQARVELLAAALAKLQTGTPQPIATGDEGDYRVCAECLEPFYVRPHSPNQQTCDPCRWARARGQR